MTRILQAVLLLALCPCFAQEISNVKASQTGDQVTITYDLADQSNKPYYVKLFMSKDGGDSFTPELKYITGDVRNVKPGSGKKIVWNAKQELGYFEGSASFKVEASIKSAPMPEPYQNQCVRVELTNVTNKNGNVKVDFTVTAINNDCEVLISPNRTYLIDAAANQFKAAVGNLGDTNMNKFKHAVKGIPIKSQLTFNGTDVEATTIPLIQIYVASDNGCGNQYRDQENTISFKNVLAEK